jgi:hypothetical protein
VRRLTISNYSFTVLFVSAAQTSGGVRPGEPSIQACLALRAGLRPAARFSLRAPSANQAAGRKKPFSANILLRSEFFSNINKRLINKNF